MAAAHLLAADVTVHFHPDRLMKSGVSVAEGLLRDGLYKSQFETGVTNGSPSAHVGGDRDRWEGAAFGNAYEEAPLTERPKYGSLNVFRYPDGGSPRFGSSYLVLNSACIDRCTFSSSDTFAAPSHFGTANAFDAVALSLVESLATPEDRARLFDGSARGITDHGRALDEYIEVHVHGDIDLVSDVRAIVVDPSFIETSTMAHIREVGIRYDIEIRHHAGFTLKPREVPSDFRGERMPALAARVAEFAKHPGQLDAAALGQAARSLALDAERWADWASPEETWQHIKQLWHVLVRFGRADGRSCDVTSPAVLRL
jgi:hypothetical protein